MTTRSVIFIGYSPQDENEKIRLLTQLGILQQAGKVELWSEDKIEAGTDKMAEINRAITRAKIAILLISADFFSDHMCTNVLPLVRERHESDDLLVFPVIAKWCAWQRNSEWLAKMSVRPKHGQPIFRENGIHADEDLAAIAEEIAVLLGPRMEEIVGSFEETLPVGDPRPKQLRNLISQLLRYHEELSEWKEVHHQLDRIFSVFGQFHIQVQRARAKEKLPDMDSLGISWRPVYQEVDKLLYWAAQDIKYTGQRFKVLEDNSMVGAPWAVDLCSLSKDIDALFRNKVYPRNAGRSSTSWDSLYNLTIDFDDTLKHHMHIADNKLRETATDLSKLSRKALSK